MQAPPLSIVDSGACGGVRQIRLAGGIGQDRQHFGRQLAGLVPALDRERHAGSTHARHQTAAPFCELVHVAAQYSLE